MIRRGWRGLRCLALIAASAWAQDATAPDPAMNARIRDSFDAWSKATNDQQKAEIRAKYGPYDLEFQKWLSVWGEDFQKAGNFPAALARFQFGADEAVVSGDMFHASICWQLIAGTERLQGKYIEAEKHYKLALEYARKPGGELRVPYVLNNMSGVYLQQGRYSDGVNVLSQAIEYHRQAGREDPAPYQNMAIAYAFQGDYVRSLGSFMKALAIYEQKGDTKKLGLTHYNLGVLQMKQGNLEAAAHEFQVSRQLSEQAGDKTQMSLTLGDYGNVQDLQGHRKEALATLEEGMKVCREVGFRQGCNDTIVNLGNIHLRHDELAEAADAYGQSLGIATELNDPYSTALALRGLAYTAQRRGDYAKVFEYASRAARTSAPLGDIQGEWQATALTGIALRATGKTAEARAALERAISLIEKQRGMVAGGDVEKQRFFEQAVFPYRELALLEAGTGNAAAALRAAERARARVLLDVLAGSPEQVQQLMTPAEREEEKTMRAAIAVLNSRLGRAKPAAVPQITQERDAAWQEYEGFLQSLYTKHPQLRAWRGDSPVVDEADLAKLVSAPGSAIVEFLSGQDELLEFVVTAGKDPRKPQIAMHRIPVGRTEIGAKSEKYRAMLEGRDPAFRTESQALYQLLLKPAEAELRGRTNVRVIPDGPLWSLPFQALSDGSGKFWIESTTLSWAHSITFLRDQAARPAASPSAIEKELLAMGDPARKDTVRVAGLADQARRIAGLYGDKAVVFTGAEAGEKAFKETAPGARVVHVAAHGVVDPLNALHSHLLLAPTGTAGDADSSDDGWLEAWELMQMRMNADLVVLSACETGRGKAADGEGLLGLTWSLFVSGARSAVVSQWRVESESTTQLMMGLHQRLRSGADGANALRGTVLALMKNPNYRHPMYWAPFIYSGR